MKPETKRNQKKKKGELEIQQSRTNNKLQNTKPGFFSTYPFSKELSTEVKIYPEFEYIKRSKDETTVHLRRLWNLCYHPMAFAINTLFLQSKAL